MSHLIGLPYCSRCQRSFRNDYALRQHKQKSPRHFMCMRCNRDHETHEERAQHYHKCHHYCSYCELFFDDVVERLGHYHHEHGLCYHCKKAFKTRDMLKLHMQLSSKHFYCRPCDREFQSQSNLDEHANSSIHRPKIIPCLFHDSCNAYFVSYAPMILHLEAGTCPSGATRTLLNQYIYTRDVGPGSLVTTQPYYEENYDILDSYSWNSDMGMWQCDLCPYMFGTIGQMKQHLMGPRHREKIFRCPNLQCGVQFRSLSGVFQHVEKEACGLSAGPTIRVLLETVLKDPEWMFE